MFPVEYYQALQVGRRERLRRGFARPRTVPAPVTAGAPLRVSGPSGEVLLTPDGVTCVDAPLEASRR
jgi:hypothetical protein